MAPALHFLDVSPTGRNVPGIDCVGRDEVYHALFDGLDVGENESAGDFGRREGF